jgi:hypothetical protein
MICHCGKKITRLPILLDGERRWWHVDAGSFKCESGDWGCPSEDLTFRYVEEKLLPGLRALQALAVEDELIH